MIGAGDGSWRVQSNVDCQALADRHVASAPAPAALPTPILISPTNGTTLFVNVFCALSVTGAIFMLLEMDQPFGGVIQVSDSPLRVVLPQLAH